MILCGFLGAELQEFTTKAQSAQSEIEIKKKLGVFVVDLELRIKARAEDFRDTIFP